MKEKRIQKMKEDNNWWQGMLVLGDVYLPFHEKNAAEKLPDVQSLVEIQCDVLNFNVVHQGFAALIGGETGTFYFESEVAEKVPRDYLAEYLPAAHKKGLKVIVYQNAHWCSDIFAKKHPDWVQVNSKNQPIITGYGSGNIFCVNGPWGDWLVSVISDLAKYEIDGVFLDGPFFVQNGCYCNYCREKFRKIYKSEIPSHPDIRKENGRKFYEFRVESVKGLLKRVRLALRTVRPGTVLYLNGNQYSPTTLMGLDNRVLSKYQDILGAEGGYLFKPLYTKPSEVPIWKPGATAKLLETQSEGKPTVVFIASTHQPWWRYQLTEIETKLLFAQTLANGANPWYFLDVADINKPGSRITSKMNLFIRKYSSYLSRTTSIAKTALLWSNTSANYFSAKIWPGDFVTENTFAEEKSLVDYSKCFQGYYDILVRKHILFDVIDEHTLVNSKKLNQYQVLIIPNCYCMSKKEVRAISTFVKDGGKLISTFLTSLYDEYGKIQENLQLAELFGIKFQEDIIGPLFYDYVETKQNFLSSELSQLVIPAPRYTAKVDLTTGNEMAHFLKPVKSRYASLPSTSINPAVIINKYGKGKSLYFSGNFDEGYVNYEIPEWKELLGSWVELSLIQEAKITNAPETIEINVRYQKEDNRLIIHLINYTGEMSRPIEKIVPINNIEINVNMNRSAVHYDTNQPIQRIKALFTDKEIPFKHDHSSGYINFKLPRLEVYEVVVVE